MKKQNILFAILICFLYGFILNTYYRPYVYLSKLNDFGFADIGNNLTFVPGVYLIYMYTNKKKLVSPYYCLLLFCIIELASFFFTTLGTFDLKDILGLIIGTLFLKLFLKYQNVKNSF